MGKPANQTHYPTAGCHFPNELSAEFRTSELIWASDICKLVGQLFSIAEDEAVGIPYLSGRQTGGVGCVFMIVSQNVKTSILFRINPPTPRQQGERAQRRRLRPILRWSLSCWAYTSSLQAFFLSVLDATFDIAALQTEAENWCT